MTFMDWEEAWRKSRRVLPEDAPERGVEPFIVRPGPTTCGPGQLSDPAPQDHLRRSDELLNLVESHGLTGAWAWIFDTDEHVWSPGCFNLLGIDPRGTRPSYALLLDRVHPDDRAGLARPTDLVRGDAPATQTFRIIRPDGTLRILCGRNDIKLGPDGAPRSALGTLLDVTERERDIKAHVSLRRQTRDLSRKARLLWFAMRHDRTFDFEADAADVLGCPPASLGSDPFACAGREAREGLYRSIADHQASGTEMQRDIVLHPLGGAPRPCRIVMIPNRDPGAVATWTGLLQVMDGVEPACPESEGEGHPAAMRGFHLRAGRALLDWSMHDLAAASGLSLSTVRRIEVDDDAQPARSRPRALSALRRAGIRFMPLRDGTVAVSRSG
ncbi:helix-turn-helix domain-containing protein [Lichenibacterium ramalinae]|nr:helix-turn-helix transcriptional regulator [Lichenibacterium ramalinae]